MVLYGITLVPLAEDLIAAYPWILSPFYVDNAVFDGSTRQSSQLLNLLMERGPDRGYFPDPAKSLFISDTPGKEEAARRELTAEGIVLNFVSGSLYLSRGSGPYFATFKNSTSCLSFLRNCSSR